MQGLAFAVTLRSSYLSGLGLALGSSSSCLGLLRRYSFVEEQRPCPESQGLSGRPSYSNPLYMHPGP